MQVLGCSVQTGSKREKDQMESVVGSGFLVNLEGPESDTQARYEWNGFHGATSGCAASSRQMTGGEGDWQLRLVDRG